jgi:hypothetical protein
MIRGLFFWLALTTVLAGASIGDWQAWTYVLSPTMAVAGRNGVWSVSSGGVVYYDTLNQSAKVYTNLDSLPSSDMAGIGILSDGTVWATTVAGDLCRLKTGVSASWEAKGSYRQSGWNFARRAFASWKDTVLLLGGPQGLSLYSTTQEIALDNVTSFGDLQQQGVHAVTVENDTVWVGLDAGAAWAVPDWKNLGKAGHLLADPTQWHVLGRSGQPITNFFRWSPTAAMNYDSSFNSAMDLPTGPLIASGWDLYWKGTSFKQYPSATYAFPVGQAVGLCIPGSGIAIFQYDGTSRILTPPTGLPATPVHHVNLEPDGTLYAWAQDGLWKANSSFSSLQLLHDFVDQRDEQVNRKTSTLQRDPLGNRLVATWGNGLWRWNGTQWKQWTAANSCLLTAVPTNPQFFVITALSSPTASGNWINFLASDNDSIRLAFLPAGGDSLACHSAMYLSSAKSAEGTLFIRAIASEGDSAVWIAHAAGIQRISGGTSTKVHAPDVLFSATDANWLAWRNGRLYYAAGGEAGYIRRTATGTWKKSSSAAFGIAAQNYRQVDVDTLGNLWAAGDAGIDVIDTAFTLRKHLDTADGLLSNNVYGFSLDASSGVVAIATDLGLDIYQSSFKLRPDELKASSVHPFPNPFRKLSHVAGKVAFAGVTTSSELFVYAADGGLVGHQEGKDVIGDQFVWEPPSGIRPGVYFWAVRDGSTTVRGRLVVSD